MKKWITVILSIVVLFGIAGCNGGGDSEQPTKQDPYIGGTRGLAIQFEEGYPPDEVYDNAQYPFDIDVRLENVGEFEIPAENVVVKISGIKPEDFGVTEDDLIKDGIDESLVPTKKDAEGNIIEGTPVHVIFENLNFQNQLDGNFNPPIRADVCYLYQTKAVSDICILENVLVDDKDAVCQINEDKKVFNSGGPIQIVDFKQVSRGQGKVGFSFTIKHKGTGKIYSPWTKCSQDLAHKDRVGVEVQTGLDGLTCTGLSEGETPSSGIAILYNGERTVTCTQEVESNLAYENRVDIRVAYDYKENIEKKILVKYSE